MLRKEEKPLQPIQDKSSSDTVNSHIRSFNSFLKNTHNQASCHSFLSSYSEEITSTANTLNCMSFAGLENDLGVSQSGYEYGRAKKLDEAHDAVKKCFNK